MSRTALYSDLVFGEAPRWHDGRLWVSDIFAKRVMAIKPDGSAQVVCEVANHPSGLGWLPDGRLLVVSILDRKVLRLDPDGLAVHADLSEVCPGTCNDMLVDAHGRAYVGNTGYEYLSRGQAVPVRTATNLVLVRPEGTVEPQPGTLMFPNGIAVSADGRTLVVAQSHAGRLTAYCVAPDGHLHGERVFAALPANRDNPDGICMDEEGAVWMADPHHCCCVRVLDGGQISHIIDTSPLECVACALGGDDRRTLFLVLTVARDSGINRKLVLGGPPVVDRFSRIETVDVSVAGAGWP